MKRGVLLLEGGEEEQMPKASKLGKTLFLSTSAIKHWVRKIKTANNQNY